jgi:hypothetical protein
MDTADVLGKPLKVVETGYIETNQFADGRKILGPNSW